MGLVRLRSRLAYAGGGVLLTGAAIMLVNPFDGSTNVSFHFTAVMLYIGASETTKRLAKPNGTLHAAR